MGFDPEAWLLRFELANGKPWGTGTNMAARASTAGANPWDTSCRVTPLIGGYTAMNEMLASLTQLIADASTSTQPPGNRGHVYIADWRLSCHRDLSSTNPWQTHAWTAADSALTDETVVGLILRLMQAGVAVRVLLWLPTRVQATAASLRAHVEDHAYLSNIVQEENERLAPVNPTRPLGIVGLDARIADGAIAGAHHQKMMVIRSPTINVAYCGGVDLTFTRRDAPVDPNNFDPTTFMDGDWQSADMPEVVGVFPRGLIWPPDNTTNYDSPANVSRPSEKMPTDLPFHTDIREVCDAMGGTWNPQTQTCQYQLRSGAAGSRQPIYGPSLHIWHDQHLKLEGPIVSTLEWQFAERWIDSARVDLLTLLRWKPGHVAFSSDDAWDTSTTTRSIVPLPNPTAVASVAGGTSIVQMWRTIPMRRSRTSTLFGDGEFTVMSGYANAIGAANELIWIFDQYFWSEPLARLLNYRIRATGSRLCVLLILPPYGDVQYPVIHRARQLALAELTRGLNPEQRDRVGVYDLWHPDQGRGIYVHAKAQTYDGSLLVCGSANMNRRSLTCDSELACAVLDPALVTQHQEQLWQLLFARVPGADGIWPALDLDVTGNGKDFVQRFKTAAASSGAFVTPDPWDDDNPLSASPRLVALPNGVPRPAAPTGPKFEVLSRVALDPGSLDPEVERDVIAAGAPPRPVRLDEIVTRVEKIYRVRSDGSVRFPNRKPASALRGSLLTWPAISYNDAAGYAYTENAEWWKQLCLGFPCFGALWWPDYATSVVEVQLAGQAVVIQLWKGWCQKFAGMARMPGGVGAEVGVYRRIPGRDLPNALPFRLGAFGDRVLAALPSLSDWWWPFPELNVRIDFRFRNPSTDAVVFSAGPQDTWWSTKWMNTDSYDRFKAANPSSPTLSWNYVLDYTITVPNSTPYTARW